MAILLILLLMVDLMVKDVVMKAELIRYGFNAPSHCSHDELT